MKPKIRCAHCSSLVHPNPRVKDQRYCSDKDCQRARKRLWQKHKLACDPDYRQNQRDAQQLWSDQNPEYWKNYRQLHPEYTHSNRQLQKVRDSRRSHRIHLAKMDALEPLFPFKQGTYYLIPEPVDLAKMDASTQKVHLIPVP